MDSLLLEVIYDDEADEPYYFIRCTDDSGTAIDIYGFDTVYSTKEDAQTALSNILKRLKRKE